ERFSDAYATGIWEALRDHEPTSAVADVLHSWTAHHLSDYTPIRDRECGRHAANQVSIGNAVTSLRLLNVLDWAIFFEATSLVEKRLRQDVGYGAQDFGTRDRCRRAVERLARGSSWHELDVAEAAL